MLLVFFFFTDTPTTGIYTYCNTLSLHDSLPILLSVRIVGGLRRRWQLGRLFCRDRDRASRCGVAGDLQHDAGLAGRALFGRDALAFGFGLLRRAPRRLVRGLDRRHPDFALMVEDRLAKVAGERSEEHTSELQSLMRISYAVF